MSELNLKTKLLFVCCFVLLFGGFERARAGEPVHAGLLFDEFELTLAPGHRTEVLGPLFYSEQKDTQHTWAFPPLMSHVEDPSTESGEFDFLYPLLTRDRYGSEYRWQVFQLLSFSGGQNQDEQKTRRFTLFPIYFQQRSEEPSNNYTAVFPFYGHMKNRLFRDEIWFVMFPCYGATRKGDNITENYCYPFVDRRHGPGLTGWQVWPFTGHVHKDVTTKTNNWGDAETIPGFDTRFVLWPFFFNQRDGIGTDNPRHIQALIPFYVFERSPQRDSTTYGPPPFFSTFTLPYTTKSGKKVEVPIINPVSVTHTIDRAKKYNEWDAPWPLIVFARGEGKYTSRVFPFFSRAYNSTLESDFYAWPIYRYSRIHSDPLDRQRTRILLFLYSDLTQKNTETGHYQRRRDFWPFYTHKRDYDGSTRLQVFAPIEPMLPENKSIERNYSPVWSVWRGEKNAKTGATSQSLLWNLYRRDTTPDSKKCSLLFGLFQYQSGLAEKRLRLFYIPVVHKTKPAVNAAEAK